MPDKSTLPSRVLEKLRDGIASKVVLGLLSIGGVILSGILSALAKWLVGLTILQRGMLWGAAETVLSESMLFFLVGLVLYLRRRAEAAEVASLVAGTRTLIRETSWVYGRIPLGTSPAASIGHTERDVREILNRLQASLVQATKFRQRAQLFEVIKYLEKELTATEKPDWNNIEPHIHRLREWADFADRKLLLKTLPSNDPLDRALF
jgi:hypothetical protein